MALGLFALSACSGAEPSTAGASPAKPAFELTSSTPKASKELDKFTWSTYAEPSTLDYAYAFDYGDNQVLSNICESLLRLNSDLTISPGLATSFENRTPTTWVYTIRDGVKFHDGTTLTADDVVASLSRHTDSSVGSYWAASFANVTSIKKTKDNEVTVTTKTPDSQVKSCFVRGTRGDRIRIDTAQVGAGLRQFDHRGQLHGAI